MKSPTGPAGKVHDITSMSGSAQYAGIEYAELPSKSTFSLIEQWFSLTRIPRTPICSATCSPARCPVSTESSWRACPKNSRNRVPTVEGYGHTKLAGKQVLRKGLSPLVTTLSTDTAAR